MEVRVPMLALVFKFYCDSSVEENCTLSLKTDDYERSGNQLLLRYALNNYKGMVIG
jgi:hypothetical protein